MKISNALNSIYQNQPVQQNQQAAATQKNAAAESQKNVINHVNVPKDYKLKPSLNKEEQKFFEGMYPKAKRDIGRYMQNQQTVQLDKGKHVDIRG